ncbi:MAG: ABC transporter substrate-binding protein [Propionibacterium sp.]|nr:ABC transporter substrate-binding protein [Propionibacterium sp.]
MFRSPARRGFGRARTAVVATTLAVVLTLGACAQRGSDPDGGSDPGDGNGTGTAGLDPALEPGLYPTEGGGEPVAGGTLTYAAQGEARSLDPTVTIAAGSTGGSQLLAVYDQLVRFDVESGEFVPQLAESVEPNDDYTQWTVTLRENVNFSDGTPLDADAVVGSVEYFFENRGYDSALIGPIWEGITKVDDRTVRFDLSAPWTTFSTMLARGPGLIVAPAAIANGPENFTPIGAGPFVLESYSPQEELVLAANPDYWAGAPHIDKLRVIWLGADETKVDALKQGNVHAAYLRSGPLTKEMRQDGQPGYLGTTNFGHMVKMNSGEGRPANDPRVRRAMALAVDPQVFWDRTYEGAGLASKSVFSEVSIWDNDIEPIPTDPEEATRLLEEAKADGFDGRVEILATQSPSARDASLAVTAMLEAVGFEVTTTTINSTADYIQRAYIEADYDITIGGDSMLDEDPYVSLAFTVHGKSVSNAIGYDDEEMNGLIDELRGTPPADRQEVLDRIEERFQEETPNILLGPSTTFMAWGKNVHGVRPSHEHQLDFSQAWIEN